MQVKVWSVTLSFFSLTLETKQLKKIKFWIKIEFYKKIKRLKVYNLKSRQQYKNQKELHNFHFNSNRPFPFSIFYNVI
jgi:hypothetical protein